MLQINDLSFNFGSRRVLQDISFYLNKGEFLVVVGPNGSGKSTLLKCVAAVLDTKECIKINGKFLQTYRKRELARIISYVPQGFLGMCSFSVQEFVMMSRYPHGGLFSKPSIRDWQVVLNALDLTGLSDKKKCLMKQLSGGESQRSLIASSLAQEPSLLLLDEMTTYLDPKHKLEIYSLLRRLHKKSALTVILVTHDINEALQYGDRILGLKAGKLDFIETPASLEKNKSLLEKLFDSSLYFIENQIEDRRVVVFEGVK